MFSARVLSTIIEALVTEKRPPTPICGLKKYALSSADIQPDDTLNFELMPIGYEPRVNSFGN